MRKAQSLGRIGWFMASNGIHHSTLTPVCGRTYGYLLRTGRAVPTLEMAAALVALFSKRLGRQVELSELVEVDGARALRRCRSRRQQRESQVAANG
jgi:hypothetical protein